MTLTEFEKGLLIGLLEGEGAIFLMKQKDFRFKKSSNGFYFSPALDFTNTDLSLVFKYEELIKKVVTIESYRTKITTSMGLVEKQKRIAGKFGDVWKHGYRVRIHDRQTIFNLLSQIKDDFVSDNKRKKAALLLEYCVLRSSELRKFRRHPYTERELAIYDELKKLNKRGLR